MRSTESWARKDAGNAVFGFVATVSLFLVCSYAIVAAALSWYVHAVISDSALAGARVAAVSGSADLARERTFELITASLSDHYAQDIAVEIGHRQVAVRVHAPIPGAGFFGAKIEVNVSAQRE